MKLVDCKRCHDVFGDFKETDYCIACEREMKAVKDDKCINCGGTGAKDDNWGCCDKCFTI